MHRRYFANDNTGPGAFPSAKPKICDAQQPVRHPSLDRLCNPLQPMALTRPLKYGVICGRAAPALGAHPLHFVRSQAILQLTKGVSL
jgi:hypothetical protein